MKNWKRYVSILLILCICAGCKSQQEYDATNNPVNEKDNNENEKQNNEQILDDSKKSQDDAQLNTEIDEVEVVFLNTILSPLMATASGVDEDRTYFLYKPSNFYWGYYSDYNQIISYYDVEENDDRLFAFVVTPGNSTTCNITVNREDYETIEEYFYDLRLQIYCSLKESLKGTKLKVIKNYPYSRRELSVGPLGYHEEFYSTANDYSAFVIAGTMQDIMELFPEGKSAIGWYCRLVSATRPDAVTLARERGIKKGITQANFSEIFGEENQVTVKVRVE